MERGGCSLVYEVVWARELVLTFGVTVFATATVLAAFMAGLALGSYWVGRWIDVHALLVGEPAGGPSPRVPRPCRG